MLNLNSVGSKYNCNPTYSGIQNVMLKNDRHFLNRVIGE